ncbi:hypothetical protein [Altibacter sp.]|uniref:hypothetical protein n=1 Tax=Altibacter sp. TaxID=2024823 RepID=UPI000C98B6D9|nr:hypothetical protein [Altibacter sp.]MAP55361.1 hypothetical protein [Altibacter sp.]|tara:strand:+ start:111 stop:626 length:516 start_codon:yes stop_codon:yes gene_type:complete
MKAATYILFTFLFFIGSGLLMAQTYSTSSSALGGTDLQNKVAQLDLLTSQIAANRNTSANNAIYIQQVGNYNTSVVNTQSNKSAVNLFQRGNNNEIILDITAANIEESVLQIGVNNSFIDLSRGNVVHSAAVIQRGKDQNLIWYGTNSISDKLLISMQGRNQTVFIRNIKR